MTTAESMALAVLKGDLAAARALADCLMNEYQASAAELPPVKRLTANRERLRVVIYVAESFTRAPDDAGWLRECVNDWLRGDRPLILHGIDRIELYEMPEAP